MARDRDGFGATGGIEFGQDRFDVRFRRGDRSPQVPGNRLVGQALHDEAQNLELPVGQGPRPKARCHLRHDEWRNRRSATVNAMNRTDDCVKALASEMS